MGKVMRCCEIFAAGVSVVLAGLSLLLAGVICAGIEVTGGFHPVQPQDRWGYTVVVLLVVFVIVLIMTAAEFMVSPNKDVDAFELRDEAQDRGATLQVALEGELFPGEKPHSGHE